MVLSTVHEILVGEDAGVPMFKYRFSPTVKVLFVEPKENTPTVVDALKRDVEAEPSVMVASSVPTSVKHCIEFHVSATNAGPKGIVVVPVHEVVAIENAGYCLIFITASFALMAFALRVCAVVEPIFAVFVLRIEIVPDAVRDRASTLRIADMVVDAVHSLLLAKLSPIVLAVCPS